MRYEDFSKFLNKHGFLVCGEDHLGHGKTAAKKEDLGYCAKKDGHKIVVKDMHKLHEIISKEYPGIPYFLLGHSMGSFLCREYIETFGDTLSGAIVMGTGAQPSALLAVAKTLAKTISKTKGERHRSELLNNMATGSYNKKFKPIVTGFEWLCRDEKQATRYEGDPLCGYCFTVNGFYNMFDTIDFIQKKENINKIPKDLPIHICAGEMDPVGNYGKAPKSVYEDYKKAGIKDVTLKLYPEDRHEILNELDQDVVYNDLLKWLTLHA